MNYFRKFILVGFLIISGVVVAEAASFDCAKASTPIETTICSNSQLSAMDEDLDAAYKKALVYAASADAVKKRQREWLKTERNTCKTASCVKAAYEKRLKELRSGDAARGKKTLTVLGVAISFGTLDSCLETKTGDCIGFLTKSEEGDMIFKACGAGACEVTGVVTEDGFFESVSRVKKK